MVEDWVAKTMYATRRRKRNARKSVVGGTKCSGVPAPVTTLLPCHQSGGLIRGGGAPEQLGGVRSNPSKRHRERLNIELECLADLLPFDNAIVSKLDKLSILRLASSYLKSKCYLRSCAESCPDLSEQLPYFYFLDDPFQTLDGFLLVVTTDGELFFASNNVEMFLGFHQSDILHQSVLELIHSEDREMFKEQLEFSHRNARQESLSTPRRPGAAGQQQRQGDDYFLQRSFTARFRCLLDNTSGFVTMDVTGRLQPFPPGFPNSLTGGNNLAAASAGIRTRPSPTSNSSGGSSAANTNGSFEQHNNTTMKANSSVSPPSSASSTSNAAPTTPTLALFAFCQPFGPGAFPVAAGQIDLAKTFKSKHALDMSFLSVDPRVRQVIEGSDEHDFFQMNFYNIVHVADLQYVATAHAELMKRGSCGILAYRIVVGGKQGAQGSSGDGTTGGLVWLQTSARVVYRCNKADTILCIHRRLSDDEGEGLIMKRASEFRLPCALFDAVDAASATSQAQHGQAAKLEAQVPPCVIADSSDSKPATTFGSSVGISARPPPAVSLGLGLSDAPPTKKQKSATSAKRSKTTTTKQKLSEQSLAPTASLALPTSTNDQPSVLLAHQAAMASGVDGAVWPGLVGATNCGSSYGAYPACYSSTSTMAEQFGHNFQQQQQQQHFNQANYPMSDLYYSYHHQQQQLQQTGNYLAGLVPSSYDEFANAASTPTTTGSGALLQQQPCLYGGADLASLGWGSRLGTFSSASDKLLATAGGGAYRMMYDDDGHGSGSPSGTGSDESPQLLAAQQESRRVSSSISDGFASVIRHTTSFQHQLQQQQQLHLQQYQPNSYDHLAVSGAGSYSSTPVTTTLFQGQPLYAATPTPHYVA